MVVVADHCSDKTAEVARTQVLGSLAHDDPEPAGKGHALEWTLRQMDGMAPITRSSSSSMRTPSSTRRSSLRSASDSTQVPARFRLTTRCATPRASPQPSCVHWPSPYVTTFGHWVGVLSAVPADLYGNGMAFERQLLDEHAWTDHLTEDLELQLELLLDDVRVDFAPRLSSRPRCRNARGVPNPERAMGIRPNRPRTPVRPQALRPCGTGRSHPSPESRI